MQSLANVHFINNSNQRYVVQGIRAIYYQFLESALYTQKYMRPYIEREIFIVYIYIMYNNYI